MKKRPSCLRVKTGFTLGKIIVFITTRTHLRYWNHLSVKEWKYKSIFIFPVYNSAHYQHTKSQEAMCSVWHSWNGTYEIKILHMFSCTSNIAWQKCHQLLSILHTMNSSNYSNSVPKPFEQSYHHIVMWYVPLSMYSMLIKASSAVIEAFAEEVLQ